MFLVLVLSSNLKSLKAQKAFYYCRATVVFLEFLHLYFNYLTFISIFFLEGENVSDAIFEYPYIVGYGCIYLNLFSSIAYFDTYRNLYYQAKSDYPLAWEQEEENMLKIFRDFLY